jgi:hypothetical protein
LICGCEAARIATDGGSNILPVCLDCALMRIAPRSSLNLSLFFLSKLSPFDFYLLRGARSEVYVFYIKHNDQIPLAPFQTGGSTLCGWNGGGRHLHITSFEMQ